MIVVSRLDRSEYAINPDLIERIVASPDTTLHMADGSTYIVAESMTEVIELIARYRAYVLRVARDMLDTDFSPESPALRVVPPTDTLDRAARAVPPPRK